MSKEWWATSDTHYFHENIIEFTGRPNKSAQEMNEMMITAFNEVVKPGDEVWHLGDVAMKSSPVEVRNLLSQLHGNVNLVLGNHDERTIARNPSYFRRVLGRIEPGIVEVKIDHQRIVMCHYALRVWNRSHHGTWHLHGHSHGTLPEDINALSIDVGVDSTATLGYGYRPIHFEEIREIMKTKTFVPVDHHGR